MISAAAGVLKHEWGIDLECIRPDLMIEGSPERSLSRLVVQDTHNNLYLLEQFCVQQYPVKNRIAGVLDYLYEQGIEEICPLIKTLCKESLPVIGSHCYQLSPYLSSHGFNRPDYLQDAGAGEALAGFLIRMNRVSDHVKSRFSFPVFSIKRYIQHMKTQMKNHDPVYYRRYRPFFRYLIPFFQTAHDRLPMSFVHGDFHPLNVIWAGSRIKAVIDWEFTGIKPCIYDAANLAGCAGIEDPEGLGMKMIMTFIRSLKKSGIFSDHVWESFFEYVLALRFAWLAEWLRKRDLRMLELEALYMKILVDHEHDLKELWQKGT